MGTKVRAAPKFYLANKGNPAVGWLINTYEPGTLIRKATHTTNAKTAENTNPIVLDEWGEADVWWSGSYKVVITDKDGANPKTIDNYGAGEEISVSGSYNLVGNSSFETDDDGDNLPDDWDITEYDATSTVVIDTGDPSHGTNCLKFVSTGLGGGYAEGALFDVSSSQPLFIGFDIKSSVVDVRNRVEVKWYDKDQILLSTTGIWDESAANPTTWTEKKFNTTAHASARFARVVLYGCHNSDATAGEARYDNIRAIAITGTMMLQDADAVAITGGTITSMTNIETVNIFTTPPVTTDYGTDLVTNGAFAADTDWTKGTGWSIAAGVANCNASQTADTLLTQNQTTINNHKYILSFDVLNYVAGNVAADFAGVEVITDKAANGTYTVIVTASGTSNDINIKGDLNFDGDIDNVSLVDLTYAATLTETAYVTDRIYNVQIHADSSAGAYLLFDGLTAIPIVNGGGTDIGNYLKAGIVYKFLYDGTSFIAVNITVGEAVGTYVDFAGETAPPGTLFCDGASYSITTYSDLFDEIGYIYGGSGASFNVPDIRGEFRRCYASGDATDPDRASRTDRGDGITGDNVGTKQADQYESHDHLYYYNLGVSGSDNRPQYSGIGSSLSSSPTSASGGNETRPTNIYCYTCIRYRNS